VELVVESRQGAERGCHFATVLVYHDDGTSLVPGFAVPLIDHFHKLVHLIHGERLGPVRNREHSCLHLIVILKNKTTRVQAYGDAATVAVNTARRAAL